VRHARTLVEAYLYISLTMSAEDTGDDVARDYRSWTTLTEGQDAWTLRFDGSEHGHDHQIELLVRYESEAEARRNELRFGSGVSELIDAGQWVQVSAAYARRALREGLFFAQDPTDDDRFQSVALGWEFARDAAIEAAKFLPDGADEAPDAAFWTEMGTNARRETPERFTWVRLQSDIDFYQLSLDDFWRLHGDRDQGAYS
jgi:hypothetical protein